MDLRVAGDYLIKLLKYIMKIGNHLLYISIKIGAGGIYFSFDNVKGDTLIIISNVIDFFQLRWEKDCTLTKLSFQIYLPAFL